MIDELYYLVGEIFEVAQYIEWNIALIVCKSQNLNVDDLFEKMQDMTLGQVINYARKVEYFEEDDILELEYILDKRNYIAHRFFKKNDIVKHKRNNIFIGDKIGELENILRRFQNFNEVLSDFYKTIKK